ncbi:MAG: phage portal protein [Clostridia bacterium]|nr:phage portal protein [Clostridia bacterium]
MDSIRSYLKNEGYNVIDDSFYSHISKWLGWYQGKVSSFHDYTQYNGKTVVARSRATLSMAKKVCEDWANLIMNEKVKICVGNESAQEFLDSVLDKNNFKVRANRLTEICFALGTGAFVEYRDGDDVAIDYVRADMIYPLAWENGRVTGCAFASERIVNGTECVYMNIHTQENGRYIVRNKLFKAEYSGLTEMNLPEGVLAEYEAGDMPMFQIITPNIVNNIDLDNPMGISVFADSIDILKGIDLVYDSYQNEFRLGKKRIIVPAGMAQISQGSGFNPLFDDNDTEFYAMTDKSLTDLREINMELRAEPHEKALQKNLNLLAAKCGLGNDRYLSSRNEIKTATEVISEKSELYQNLKKHELVFEKAAIDMARAVLYLGGFVDEDISISFDDSIIEDTGAVAERAMEELKNGIIDKKQYLMRVYNMSENQAENMVK